MSERIIASLQARRKDQTKGWVFPSDSMSGHLTTVATAFETARAEAKLSSDIKLYSARHTFATKVLAATGNLSLVMRTLGHSNAQTAMIYQHPNLEDVRQVVNARPVGASPKLGPILLSHSFTSQGEHKTQ
jgi:site-specific recombinase XerD